MQTSALLPCAPARKAVLSWNTQAPSGELAFRIFRNGQPASVWLLHSAWSERDRRSFSPHANGVRVQTDVITAEESFDGIEVQANDVPFEALAVATPFDAEPRAAPANCKIELPVAARSQYVVDGQRGWCSPASLSMLHGYYGKDVPVAQVAAEVFDSAYEGTGNWSFNVAYSGRVGLRGLVVYLRDLAHAARFIERTIPLAVSYSWNEGELPGAPLEHSEGHLAVLRGFTKGGDPLLNDPASPELRSIYRRDAFERAWERSGRIAYLVAPNSANILPLING